MKKFIYLFIIIASTMCCSKDDDSSNSNPLLLNYMFNGDFTNEAVTGNNGVQLGGVAFVDDRNAVPLSASKFDGIDDRIKFNNPIKTSNIEAFTVSGWFKNGERFGGDQVVVLRSETITNVKISKVDPETTKVCFDNFIGPSWKVNCYEIPTNGWFHMVGIYKKDSGTQLYINGNLVNEISFSGNMGKDFTIDSHLGAIIRDQVSTEPNTFWNGQIDDFRIYSKALSQSEISELFMQ